MRSQRNDHKCFQKGPSANRMRTHEDSEFLHRRFLILFLPSIHDLSIWTLWVYYVRTALMPLIRVGGLSTIHATCFGLRALDYGLYRPHRYTECLAPPGCEIPCETMLGPACQNLKPYICTKKPRVGFWMDVHRGCWISDRASQQLFSFWSWGSQQSEAASD